MSALLLATAVALFSGQLPPFDLALCREPAAAPAAIANESGLQGLLRLQEPRVQECLAKSQLASGARIAATVSAAIDRRTVKVNASGSGLSPASRSCIVTAVTPAVRSWAGHDVRVHAKVEFLREPFSVSGAPPDVAELLRRIRAEESGWCQCFQAVTAPATLGLELTLRPSVRGYDHLPPTPVRPAFVSIDAPGDPALYLARSCVHDRIAEMKFKVRAARNNVPVEVGLVDSSADSVGQGPSQLGLAQAIAILSLKEADALLATARRQRAFETLDAGIVRYDKDRGDRRAATELAPLKDSCLALVESDDALSMKTRATIAWVQKALEQARGSGASPAALERKLTAQTAFLAQVGEERAQHASGCSEIAHASEQGLTVTRVKAPRKPRADELFRAVTRDIARRPH